MVLLRRPDELVIIDRSQRHYFCDVCGNKLINDFCNTCNRKSYPLNSTYYYLAKISSRAPYTGKLCLKVIPKYLPLAEEIIGIKKYEGWREVERRKEIIQLRADAPSLEVIYIFIKKIGALEL